MSASVSDRFCVSADAETVATSMPAPVPMLAPSDASRSAISSAPRPAAPSSNMSIVRLARPGRAGSSAA